MTPPGITVEVEHVRGIIDQWAFSGNRLSALHFPEFVAVPAPGSAVATVLRSLASPAEQSCRDIGERLVELAEATDKFLQRTSDTDSSAGDAFAGHR